MGVVVLVGVPVVVVVLVGVPVLELVVVVVMVVVVVVLVLVLVLVLVPGPEVVVELPGPVVVGAVTWGEIVARPRPRMANRYSPCTTWAAWNMVSAIFAVTRGRIVPAGSTVSPPLSSSTWVTKRPPTTDDNDGTFDAGALRGVSVTEQEHRHPAATTSAAPRSRPGRGCTGHSLPGLRR